MSDVHPTLLVNDRLAAAITALPEPRQRELAMDLAVNRRFRRDLFQQNRLDVLRNVLYLVAGGGLVPLARHCHRRFRGTVRFASETAQRAVLRVAASPAGGWIPSPVAGAGIHLGAAEARGAIQAVEEQLAHGEQTAPLARLVRLGVLTTEDFSPEGSG